MIAGKKRQLKAKRSSPTFARKKAWDAVISSHDSDESFYKARLQNRPGKCPKTFPMGSRMIFCTKKVGHTGRCASSHFGG